MNRITLTVEYMDASGILGTEHFAVGEYATPAEALEMVQRLCSLARQAKPLTDLPISTLAGNDGLAWPTQVIDSIATRVTKADKL